ncbi:sensor histidine kinase [Bacillus sp. FJAT-29790]|uniref:sensor histidine kinase n=1 Tax=Bacillus sp. FJAT-29790 TaxID=1895002 RepID=UPI001C23F1D2|nr:sensor histidine kinase [Bacillus sp. FJAT-29790]MBU8880157.1 sensor histidine kinase [Bacillus sp. FJAT-29790]
MFKTSIRNKLIILLMITTILPFGTSIIITYIHTKESLKNQVVQENSNLLYQGKVNLENYINELNRLTLSLYNNADFMNFMRSANNSNNYLTIGIIKNVMQTILYAEDHIDRVHISVVKDDRVISASKRSNVVFSTKENAMKNDHFVKAKESSFGMYIEPMQKQNGNSNKGSKNVITIHRSFTNIPSNEVLAFISLEIKPDKIFELSENLYNSKTEEFYILSSEGDLIYSSNTDVSANLEKQKWIERILLSKEEKGTIEWKEDSFNGVMIYDQMAESAGGWFLVKRVPYAILYESAFNVAKINIMFGVVGLLLVIMATLFVSLKITSPIRVLLQNIQEVEAGNMNVQFESFGKDEIGILGFRFKQMIQKINDLINREYKLELENKTNQLKVLQSQINPHFLYNALQSIGTVALKNNVPQIYPLVTHLSKIMRYGMNTDEDIVPLIKEINYTKAYLLLQKERFGEQLEYSIDIDEEFMNIHVPKMILQPIIENYFKHGFDIRDGVGEIRVECKKEGADLLISVLDNGAGVTESRLEEIYQNFEEGTSIRNGEETNIGLRNVYVRLMLYYDGLATLQLKNHEGAGLLVTIRLPISVEGGENESDHS